MPTLTKVPFIKENELLGDPDPGSNTEGFIPLPDDRLIPQAGLEEHLSGQLDVRRLNAIHDRLWRAGLPGKVHPLHHQIVLQGNIIVTERVDLHLVWTSDRIFVKPLPSFLVSYTCFEKNISPDMSLLASALGFLHTYINMIEYHADFSLAKDLGLLPSTVTWRAWNLFRMDIQQNITQSHQINKRYHYGELRLSRLNSIYRVHQRSWRGGYFLVHTRYQSFFRANFEWLLLAFAYISVALSALQVLVTTNQSQQNMSPALKGVSLGIGTASIVSVMTVVLVMLALFITLRVTNEAFAKSKSVYVEHDFALGDLKVSSFKVL